MESCAYINGAIHALDAQRHVWQALYVENGIIRNVGTTAEIAGLCQNVVDLGGRAVIPGFHDSHLHLLSYGMALESLGGRDCRSKEEVLEAGRARLQNESPSALWLGGFVSPYLFSKEDLDTISADIPIFYSRVNGHTYVPKANIMSKICCNSRALKLAHITADTQPPGGTILLGEHGPTGLLKGLAAGLVFDLLPQPNREMRKQALVTAVRRLAALGITAVHSNDLENGDRGLLELFRELDEEGKLAVRVSLQCLFEHPSELEVFLTPDPRPAFNKGRCRISALKLLLDGTLGDHTAATVEPYRDLPDSDGVLLFCREDLVRMVGIAHAHNLPVVMHAIGTRAIRQGLSALAAVTAEYGKKDLRHGLIHCLLTEPESFQTMAEVGVCALIQPISVADDYEIVTDRVGPEAASTAYAWKTMLNHGILVAGGTDCPCDSPNPFESLHCAVTRQNLQGQPTAGFQPEQRLTLDEALTIMTVNGAFLAGEERLRGSLEPGKAADFIVLSQDIFCVDPALIPSTRAVITVSEGVPVHCEVDVLAQNVGDSL